MIGRKQRVRVVLVLLGLVGVVWGVASTDWLVCYRLWERGYECDFA